MVKEYLNPKSNLGVRLKYSKLKLLKTDHFSAPLLVVN